MCTENIHSVFSKKNDLKKTTNGFNFCFLHSQQNKPGYIILKDTRAIMCKKCERTYDGETLKTIHMYICRKQTLTYVCTFHTYVNCSYIKKEL